MAKRISDMQRLINFAMGADESGLNSAIESLTAIRANRYPKDSCKPRKARSDSGKSRTRTPTSTPTANAAGDES